MTRTDTMAVKTQTGASNDARTGRPAPQRALPQNISRLEQRVSTVAGSLLLLGGVIRGKWAGLVMSGLGGSLLYRGLTGHCHGYDALGINTAEHPDSTVVPAQQGVHFEKRMVVQRPPKELFSFWRHVENLPRIMRHLKSVEAGDDKRSHWVAEGPFETQVEWDAEIFNERENEMIAWRSLPGGDVDTAGSVHFKPLGHDRGTEIIVTMKYNPPAGKVGARIASILGNGAEREIDEDLRQFKSLMEAGAVATTEGQPGGAGQP